MENFTTAQEFANSQLPEVMFNNYKPNVLEKSTSLIDHLGVNQLYASVSEFITLSTSLGPNFSENYLKTCASVHRLLDAILIAEKFTSKEVIKSILKPVKEIHRQSVLCARTQDWPRGYAGDFETIEYIIGGENKSEKNSLGYFIEAMALNSPIVQQHRNKIIHQSSLILKKAYQSENPKVLSIGCGSSADLRFIENSLKRTNISLTLFDMDEGALACSEEKLPDLKNKCKFIQGNLLRLVKRIEDKFDLVVIGGVFDYLNDKTIISFLNKLFNENLNPKGEIYFTNIANNNPYRTWMEYCFNWELIERSKTDIINLYEKANLTNCKIDVYKEETSLTYLAHISSVE